MPRKTASGDSCLTRVCPRSLAHGELTFPFPAYRLGQREVAVAAYRVLANGGRLFLAAPTRIGKTVSVLFPAVKAPGEGKQERIF